MTVPLRATPSASCAVAVEPTKSMTPADRSAGQLLQRGGPALAAAVEHGMRALLQRGIELDGIDVGDDEARVGHERRDRDRREAESAGTDDHHTVVR